jgi:hypothetical protein
MRILICLALLAIGCKDKKTEATPSAAGSGPAAAAKTVAEPPQAAKLPGTCVDVVADAAKRAAEPSIGGLEGEPPHDVPGAPDLDGDGSADRLFAISGGGTNVATFAYVMRGSCGHYVGNIGSTPEATPKAEKRNGLVDVRVIENSACEGAPCGCDVGEDWYRFDGTEYQHDKAASKASVERECAK